MSEMTWVAKRDGTGWTSNRTRDVVDLAFTVSKAVAGDNSEVIVRCTWSSAEDARARRTIGRYYFPYPANAKVIIEEYLKDVNSAYTDKVTARAAFLDSMLRASMNEGGPGKGNYMYPYSIVNNRYVTQSDLTSATTFNAVEMMEKIEEASAVAEEAIDLSLIKPGDPAPKGYIWMGKELMQIGWPS